MHVDYLLVGLGISGSLLSRELIRAGKKVLVIDQGADTASAKVAGGLINPVTGKRLVKSWMTDTLLPEAIHTYRELEAELQQPLLHEYTMLHMFGSHEQRHQFGLRAEEAGSTLHACNDAGQWEAFFAFDHGMGASDCWLVHMHGLVQAWRGRLLERASLRNELFRWDECRLSSDKIVYKDIVADRLICCEGAAGARNPWFARLPWSLNKGEVLWVSIPGLPRDHIYYAGLKLIPWGNDLFWAGSSYQWDFTDAKPTTSFRLQTEHRLRQLLKLPFTVRRHIAAIRPATLDHRPFIGFHPLYGNVGIFNGMGTKACSLAPYFSKRFAACLMDKGVSIQPDADIKRFSRILSK